MVFANSGKCSRSCASVGSTGILLKNAKTNSDIKRKSLGANYVPAHQSIDGKLSSMINYFLPEDCRVRTRADFYYVTAVAFICATLVFPPFVVGAIVCVIKAKRKKGGQQ